MDWIKRFRRFVTEVWAELKKTSWPARREVYGTTMVVIVMIFICAVYLFVVDKILETAITKYLFGAFGR